MPTLEIGKTSITYNIRESFKAQRVSLCVGPESVEVVVPSGADSSFVEKFIQSKREWIFLNHMEFKERELINVWPATFLSGSKMYLKGRHRSIRRSISSEVGFIESEDFKVEISAPKEMADRMLKRQLVKSMVAKLDSLLTYKVGFFADGLVDEMPRFRIRQMKDKWGYCCKNNELHFNWELIFVPSFVLDYLVIHEICHIHHRDHNDQFWSLVKTKMPNYQEATNWLSRHILYV